MACTQPCEASTRLWYRHVDSFCHWVPSPCLLERRAYELIGPFIEPTDAVPQCVETTGNNEEEEDDVPRGGEQHVGEDKQGKTAEP